MIALNLPAVFSHSDIDPFVARFSREAGNGPMLVGEFYGQEIFQEGDLTIEVSLPPGDTIAGDVVYVDPNAGRVSRWIRNGSPHNTLLITEQCDQLCIMCSQPPKKSHKDLFEHFLTACLLAPENVVIGLSGGEPLLHKAQIFDLIEQVIAERPDLSFHVLTNAQHIDQADIERLRGGAFRRVLWGVPLYAPNAELHDQIVGKAGAYDRLLRSLAHMGEAGLAIELRTVMLRQNYDQLSHLSRWVSARLPFISVWAIMQLERAGFARTRWSDQFVDHSANLKPLTEAVAFTRSRGVDVALYNVPHCTVSAELRGFLHNSISDWKRAFPKSCDGCQAKSVCSGFFEWHAELKDYVKGGIL